MPRYFRILLFGEAPSAAALRFDDRPDPHAPRFRFAGADTPYLRELRAEFALDSVVEGAATEYERLRAVSRWVRTRWEHGQDAPGAGDALSILREAAAGGREFRCVEYARVAAASLSALGMPGRVVGLWKRDVATSAGGASHVAAEAYLRSLGRWVMVDAQFDATPVLDGAPLSALDLQRALAGEREGVGVDSTRPLRADQYLEWVAPYLYHIHAYLDNAYRGEQAPEKLMLLPVSARVPSRFQQDHRIEDMVPTHSVAAFYASPEP